MNTRNLTVIAIAAAPGSGMPTNTVRAAQNAPRGDHWIDGLKAKD